MIRLSHMERKHIYFFFFKKGGVKREETEGKKGREGGKEKERKELRAERKITNICLASALLERKGIAFTSKVFHNFKKTLKGESLGRGSKEGKILHIINDKHMKMYL